MKTVLVTGGMTRLGLAIAERLRADGWRVFTSSHRPGSGADFIADFSNPMGAVRLYAAVSAALDGQPPGALVNNAALFSGESEVLEAVNVTAPKKLATLMACREDGVGSVVNILDCRVLKESEGDEGAYARTKRELLSFTRSAAAMFAMTLRMNAVAPGPVLAPVSVHERAGDTPLGRPAPEDVAEAVAFLLRAPATSGCVIPVDGGQSLDFGLASEA